MEKDDTMKDKFACTDFLFPKTSFFIGAGSAFNLPGNFYEFNHSKSGLAADHKAIDCDWIVVGNDFSFSIEKQLGESKLTLGKDLVKH
jgi:hypothetical protein